MAFVALLPLTPGNLGTAEWGWVGVLTLAGEGAVEAALLALGTRLLALVAQSAVLVGVCLWPFGKGSPHDELSKL